MDRFELLGPLRVTRDHAELRLGGTKQRTVLAMLLLRAGSQVHRDTLIHAVWRDQVPLNAANALQTYLKRLRQLLEPERPNRTVSALLPSVPFGYTALVLPQQLDSLTFLELAKAAQEAQRRNDHTRVRELTGRALALWRGEVCADLPQLCGDPAIVSLQRERDRVFLSYCDATLKLEQAADIISTLEQAADADPFNEAILSRLIRSYHAMGWRSKAIGTYDSARRRLASTLGIDPGAELTATYQQLLHDSAIPIPAPAIAATRAIPAALTPLIGRDDELRSVVDLLRNGPPRHIVITGVAGIGKTRLALEAARLLNTRDMPAFWVPLAGITDTADVPVAIAEALAGDSTSIPQAHAIIGDRELTVVLDNLEHLHSVGSTITSLLTRCPGLRVLSTSRKPAGVPGEWERPITPLAVPDQQQVGDLNRLADVPSVRLFVDRVQAIRPGFGLTVDNAPAVADLCRRLDGLPLGIELLARQCRALDPGELLGHLPPRLLGSPSVQPLRDAISANCRLLTPRSRNALSRLAVCRGTWSFEITSILLGTDETLPALNELLGHGLVLAADSAAGRRFTMLEIIRQFATEQADIETMDATAAKHAEFFLALAGELAKVLESGADPTTISKLDQERDNLRAALEWLRLHDRQRGVQLANSLYRYWLHRGRWQEGLRWYQGHLTGNQIHDSLTANARLRAASLAAVGSEHEIGREFAAACLRDFTALRDQAGVAQANSTLGMINRRAGGDPQETARRHRAAVAAAEDAGDARTQARCLNNLVSALLDGGKLEEAQQCSRKAFQLASAAGDLFTAALSEHAQGSNAWLRNNLNEADEHFEKSVELAKQVGSLSLQTHSLADRAIIQAELGHIAAAIEFAAAAMSTAEESAVDGALGTAQLAQAEVQLAQGKPAVVAFSGALELLVAAGDFHGGLDALGGICASAPPLHAATAARLGLALRDAHRLYLSNRVHRRLSAVTPDPTSTVSDLRADISRLIAAIRLSPTA